MSVKCLIYCSKAKPYLFGHYVGFDTKYQYDLTICKQVFSYHKNVLNGKIVASFDCEKVEEIVYNGWWNCYADNDSIEGNYFDNDLACLNEEELKNYLGDKKGYAIHISNLQVFDEPLSFDKDYIYKDYKTNELIEKAPQNMCNVYDRFGNHYILISIKPEWVCKILNGEKTIEVRKSVVKALKGLI